MKLTGKWFEEFYPVPATEVAAEDALAHALNKWLGYGKLVDHLTDFDKDMLNETKSQIEIAEWEVHVARVSAGHLWVGSTEFPYPHILPDMYSCALCIHFYNDERTHMHCVYCPLAKARNGFSCGTCIPYAEIKSPYEAFVTDLDYRPMLGWLTEAMESHFV